MPTLRQEISTRGIQGDIPAPNDETTIQDLDPIALLELQAMFGELVHESPRLVRLINNTAPILFATLLFTAAQAYEVTEDGEGVEPSVDILTAENEAIGHIRSVAAAIGKLSGEITVEPSDAEVDADTELNPV